MSSTCSTRNHWRSTTATAAWPASGTFRPTSRRTRGRKCASGPASAAWWKLPATAAWKDFALAVDRCSETYLIPARKASGQGKEAEISSEEIDEVFYSDPRISIADMVNEQIILELPAAPPLSAGLCRALPRMR